ncbi:MFS transporter [Ornithinimicrobium sp. W1665]|uniref:MFS transporter n=1 Tax=Ornithinimicrobium sp. W1665 TaxID=3416666 RepID=UPI003D6C68A7
MLIGTVMGGTQALSRSLYSQLVPQGRESEFFSFYQAMERGTSWFGTLAFGLTYQLTGSYRPAILVTIAFFVVGGLILTRVRVREGIAMAGNEQPRIV